MESRQHRGFDSLARLAGRDHRAQYTPAQPGKFEDSLEFYTDAPGQLIVSESFTGEAR